MTLRQVARTWTFGLLKGGLLVNREISYDLRSGMCMSLSGEAPVHSRKTCTAGEIIHLPPSPAFETVQTCRIITEGLESVASNQHVWVRTKIPTSTLGKQIINLGESFPQTC